MQDVSRLRRWLERIYQVSGALAAICLAAICLLVSAQVVLNALDKTIRWVTGTAVGLSIPSYSDFTGFLLAASSFLALAYTLRAGGHIRVTLFVNQLDDRKQRWLEIWSLGIAGAVTAYFAWYSIHLVLESRQFGDVSAGIIAVPEWIPQSGMAVGAIVLFVALADGLICTLRGDCEHDRRPEQFVDPLKPDDDNLEKSDD